MRTFIICIGFLIFNTGIQAQEKPVKESHAQLGLRKKNIVAAEKEELKARVEEINLQLENREITAEEAQKLKMKAAKNHAKNIENRLAIVENKMALLERNDTDSTSGSYWSLFSDGKVFDFSSGKKAETKNKEFSYGQRTQSDIVIAFGLNNALGKGQSLNDSDFKIGGSRFFEVGWAWKTRVFEKSNWLRFKYGVSFQFNGLKPTDNRYFISDREVTTLEEFPLDLRKSKFRMDNLVIPIHFEFGPSRKVESDSGVRFYTNNKLKVGLGGYAGLLLGDRQKLKYREDGEKVKKKMKKNYNTNDLVYGLSGYIGWNGAALYVKYDLNPIFESPNPELHNVSLGLRFDLD